MACSSDSLKDSYDSSEEKTLQILTKQSKEEYFVSPLTNKQKLDASSSVSSTSNLNQNASLLTSSFEV